MLDVIARCNLESLQSHISEESHFQHILLCQLRDFGNSLYQLDGNYVIQSNSRLYLGIQELSLQKQTKF